MRANNGTTRSRCEVQDGRVEEVGSELTYRRRLPRSEARKLEDGGAWELGLWPVYASPASSIHGLFPLRCSFS